jgi:hypothetical protein
MDDARGMVKSNGVPVGRFLRDVVQIAFVLAVFVGMLALTTHYYAPARLDKVRAEDAKSLKAALARYHAARGNYPLFAESPVGALKSSLVAGGYLAAIPDDPLRLFTGAHYLYVSNGTFYGILFKLQTASEAIPAGVCIIGANTDGTGIWGQPPECPF